jgi:hypothetical protein
MHVRWAGSDASKPRQLMALHAKPEVRQQLSEGVDGFDLAVEREFGAWKKADGHPGLAHHREATGFCPGKSG